MSLNVTKLSNVRELANGDIQARCPACAEAGHDRRGEHLQVYPDGRFGCCVYPEDREHRKRIFALAGDTSPRDIKVKPAVRVATSAKEPGGRQLVLGRFGRVSGSPAKDGESSDASDGVNEVGSKGQEVRTLRTGETESIESTVENSRTLRTPLNPYTCEKDNNCIKVQGVPVGASEPSEIQRPQLLRSEFEKGVRSVRAPYITPAGDLVIPFDSPERYHWWKGGQSVAETRAEVLRTAITLNQIST